MATAVEVITSLRQWNQADDGHRVFQLGLCSVNPIARHLPFTVQAAWNSTDLGCQDGSTGNTTTGSDV